MRTRRGFTMIEVIASTVLLVTIVIGVTALTVAINSQKTDIQNTVYLSVHNLTCMERVKEMAMDPDEELLNHYDDDTFGTGDIYTEVFVEQAFLDNYSVYEVKIVSKMRDFKQKLTSLYTVTDIGKFNYTAEFGE